MGQRRILNHVVQQGGHDGVFIQTHVHGDVGRSHTVGHIGGAILALLPLVSGAGHLVGRADALEIEVVSGGRDFLLQLGVHLIRVEKHMRLSVLFHSDVPLSQLSSQVWSA